MTTKKRVGWFTFTCCEDNTIMFTELLNRYYKVWLPKIDFVHARIFRKEAGKELTPMDIAFVEGAINSDRQAARLREIRGKAAILIAIGSCAVTGSPSNQRNAFNESQLEEIRPILKAFNYNEKTLKLSDVVTVDESVPGCPMNEQAFIDIMNKYLSS